MIGIIDYGAGNVHAIVRILGNLKVDHKVVKYPNDFSMITKLILPGVGSFDAVMNKINNSGLRGLLDDLVMSKQVPVLGICVGMQIMANNSEEGSLKGLGWVDASVKKFNDQGVFYVPHMGWNTVNNDEGFSIFEETDKDLGYYFVHSYYFDLLESVDYVASTDYILNFISAFQKDNIIGIQFHPEKSHSNGIKMFEKFCFS